MVLSLSMSWAFDLDTSSLVFLWSTVSAVITNFGASFLAHKSFLTIFCTLDALTEVSCASCLIVMHLSSRMAWWTSSILAWIQAERGRPHLLWSAVLWSGFPSKWRNQNQIWVWLRAWSFQTARTPLITLLTSNPHAMHALMVALCSRLHSIDAHKKAKSTRNVNTAIAMVLVSAVHFLVSEWGQTSVLTQLLDLLMRMPVMVNPPKEQSWRDKWSPANRTLRKYKNQTSYFRKNFGFRIQWIFLERHINCQEQPLFSTGDSEQGIDSCQFNGLTLLHFQLPSLVPVTRATGDQRNPQLHLRFNNPYVRQQTNFYFEQTFMLFSCPMREFSCL